MIPEENACGKYRALRFRPKTVFSGGCERSIAAGRSVVNVRLPSARGLAQLVGEFFPRRSYEKTEFNLYIIGRKRRGRFQP
ncbi:MAG: hypothetical protein IJQ53_03735 [Clostridia bacterium]|nr:hypothetical protein [Clostridia bacterium]